MYFYASARMFPSMNCEAEDKLVPLPNGIKQILFLRKFKLYRSYVQNFVLVEASHLNKKTGYDRMFSFELTETELQALYTRIQRLASHFILTLAHRWMKVYTGN